MIRLTRFDGTQFVLNTEIIQYLEATPDTIITLNTGDKLIIRETVEEVIEAVIEFKKRVFVGAVELNRDENTDYIE